MKDDIITRAQSEVVREQKHRDGIPQIVAGLFVILSMLLIGRDKGQLMVVFIPLIVISIEGMRKRITYPRIGYVKVQEPKVHRGLMLIILAVILALGAVLFTVTIGDSSISRDVSRILYPIMMLVVAAMIVAMMLYRFLSEKNTIMIIYALFIVLLVVAIWIFHLRQRTVLNALIGFGAANLVFGVVSLISFIRKYPIIPDHE